LNPNKRPISIHTICCTDTAFRAGQAWLNTQVGMFSERQVVSAAVYICIRAFWPLQHACSLWRLLDRRFGVCVCGKQQASCPHSCCSNHVSTPVSSHTLQQYPTPKTRSIMPL
jgi:hypothetical protein